MEYVNIKHISKDKLTEFFEEHWGSPEMVISSGKYRCDQLPGFACILDGNIVGLVTYTDRAQEREIISLDAVIEKRGIGSKLMKLAEDDARKLQIPKITLVTTNDNLNALKFYQKRNYRLVKILNNAVEKAREIKPQIPLIGYDEIPILDEILLEKAIITV